MSTRTKKDQRRGPGGASRRPPSTNRARPPAGDLAAAPSAALIAACLAAILLAGIACYSNSFRGVLVLDDVRAIALNTSIKSFATALSPPGESTVAGRPVANFSFAINYALAPEDVRDVFSPDGRGSDGALQNEAFLRNIWGYHALNLAIHLAAGMLVFGIVRRTPGRLWPALAAALLWVVHPLHTEAITYVVQRVESLAGLFYLLTLYCAVRAAERPRATAWGAACVASCALGMGTKEVMVTAPLIVVLWDWTFSPRPIGARRKWLWSALASTWVILLVLVVSEHRAPSLDLGQGMMGRYLLTQAGVIVHYLRLAIVPSPLVFLYTWPIASSATAVLPQLVLLAVLVALTVAALVRRHPLGLAGAWFFLVLAPTSSILPIVTEVAAEHRMYLPLAAVLASLVGVIAAAGRRLGTLVARDVPRVRRLRTAAGLVAVAAATVALGAATASRNREYWSDEALWRDTVEKQPDNPRARIAYGQVLLNGSRAPEAEAQLREGVRLAPTDLPGRALHGASLAAQGRLGEAIPEFRRAVQLSGGRDVQALTMLSSALAEVRQYGEAAAAAATAAQVAREQNRGAAADELERRGAAYRAMADRGPQLPY